MNKYFEIIIFTAAAKEYADIIIDYIDPEKKLIKKRYYRRDVKLNEKDQQIKDLTILGKDLSKTLIIDNVPENFIKQKENGIFVKSWYDDPDDTCLLDLIPILKELVVKRVDDVRFFMSQYRQKLIEHIRKGSIIM